MSNPLHYQLEGAVAVLRLDDGKANAISYAVLDAMEAAVQRAESEAGALLLLGRPGRFSAGFDLSVIRQGADAAQPLIRRGAGLLLRLAESGLPVIAGCTGHALAQGALLLLASDLRLGARGDFKIGLNEVAIDLPLPNFALALAAERLAKSHRLRATVLAEIYDPEAAVEAGYLDRTLPPEQLESTARAEAARLAELPRDALRVTKRGIRSETLRRIRADIAD